MRVQWGYSEGRVGSQRGYSEGTVRKQWGYRGIQSVTLLILGSDIFPAKESRLD